MKVSLYVHDLNLVVHSGFDELHDKSYEGLLIHNPSNDCVHERGPVDEDTQLRLQIESKSPLWSF